ncbi:endonuclease/exonuclease/phosphatase family protein [Microbulbifer sp. HZ11]|uniref:endonuclease/exonuclease/phosphatase family protein n=1 Tax=Microbulbifer sp. HZ11 TaxID=1453501 RepID=UPI0005BC8FE0|nr:endonuclease/exonuclease/phosphatase family protein [Microbulbifer sp. HZ11]
MRMFLSFVLLKFLIIIGSPLSFADSAFSVMTFNLRHSGEEVDAENGNKWEGKRDQQVINAVLSKIPDILGVQEMAADPSTTIDPRDYVRTHLEFEYDFYKGIGGSPKDIFYRKTKFSVEHENSGADYIWPDSRSNICPGSNGEGKARSITWATLVDLESGNKLFVVNVHLHHKARDTEIRVKQMECIRNHIEVQSIGLPVILLGDLNSLYGGYEICTFEKGFHENQKPMFDASGTDYNATFNGFCVDCKHDAKLDYIFLRGLEVVGGPEIVRYSYFDSIDNEYRWPSDHFPLYAELEYHSDSAYVNLEQSACNKSGFSLFW